jgi:16S rRNA G966 N2-methylase RsmD
MASLPQEIKLLEQAGAFLARCQDLDEVKKIRDKAEAMRLYAKQQARSQQAMNAAAVIKLRAERRMGELLAESPKRNGARDGKTGSHVATPLLKDIGISKSMSSRVQAIAAVPIHEFEATCKRAVDANRELTSREMCEIGRFHQRSKGREIAIRGAAEIGGDIHTGDMSLLDELVADDSADLFFTDPPYHGDQTHLFGRLAELARRKLKPGGFCLAYSGKMYLPDVMAEMSRHLEYYWMFGIGFLAEHAYINSRRFWDGWKPILVFAKRPVSPPDREWSMDFQQGTGRDKRFHEWGQNAKEAAYWIDKLTKPGALVVDPFCGGGAIPAACKATGRRWIATEIDERHAAIARSRVSSD